MPRIDRITTSWIRSPADEAAVDAGCRFNLAAADRVRGFFAKFLQHSKGEFAGKPFELLDWEWKDFIAPIFGWRRPGGTRRFRRAAAWVPKKQGKSTLAAGLVLYGLIADREPGAHIYGAAADRAQASLIFEEAANMVDQSPGLSARLQVVPSTKRIVYEAKRSFYRVLSAESRRTGHGINAHFAVIDELHVVTRAIYDTLRYATAARRQPLFLEISTAGNDKESLGYERYCYAKNIVTGDIKDPEYYAFIAEADGNDKWEDPEQWHKANPSLGTTISVDSFTADFREAKQGSALTQANFRQLRLNLWQDSTHSWLPVEEWDACRADIDLDELKGQPCYGGLDLASKLDLTAFVMVFVVDDEYWIVPRFWCPEEADQRRQQLNKAKLVPWINAGLIKTTPGNVTDYDLVEKDVQDDAERFELLELAYDPWNCTQVATHLQDQGLTLIEFPQTIRNFNEPMKEFEKLVLSRKIHHDGNEVFRWMIKNVVARKDSSGNVRPDKEKSQDHIDGVTGALMGLARAIMAEGQVFISVYDTPGNLAL